jgi:hypothetical protein
MFKPSAACSLLRAGDLSCVLDVLNVGQEIIVQYAIAIFDQKYEFIQIVKFENLLSSNPWIRISN